MKSVYIKKQKQMWRKASAKYFRYLNECKSNQGRWDCRVQDCNHHAENVILSRAHCILSTWIVVSMATASFILRTSRSVEHLDAENLSLLHQHTEHNVAEAYPSLHNTPLFLFVCRMLWSKGTSALMLWWCFLSCIKAAVLSNCMLNSNLLREVGILGGEKNKW